METIIGFAIGYLVGSREGRAGLERARTSLRAIVASEELRQLAAGAAAVAAPMIKQVAGGNAGVMLSGAVDALARKASSSMAKAA